MLDEITDDTLDSKKVMESLGNSSLLQNLLLTEEHKVLMPIVLVLEKMRNERNSKNEKKPEKKLNFEEALEKVKNSETENVVHKALNRYILDLLESEKSA